MEEWRFAEADSATQAFGNVTINFRRAGRVGSALTAGWRKAGFDFKAALISDGFAVKDADRGGQIERLLRGLKLGRHSNYGAALTDSLTTENIAWSESTRQKSASMRTRRWRARN